MANSTYYQLGDNIVKQYINSLTIEVDEYWSDGNIGDNVYFTVYIFIDDFATVSEQNINTDTSSSASSTDYGIRISKDGYDVKTCDDINCVLSSSQGFSVLVHKKGVQDNSSILLDSIFTANASTDTITCTAHGLSNGDRVLVYSFGTLPGGLAEFTDYYVINSATNTFKVSLTNGGSAVNITSAGSGDHYVYEIPYIDHNLGYVPAIIGYSRNSGNSYISYKTNDIDSLLTDSANDYFYYIIFKNRNDG